MRKRPPGIDGLAASTLQLAGSVADGAGLPVRTVPCRGARAMAGAHGTRACRRRRRGRGDAGDTPSEVHYYREVADEPSIPFHEVVLHADDDLLVADKPPFLPVTPADGHVHEALLGRLTRRTGNHALVPLHRIDRETEGLVLFSANPASRARYHALFRERRIGKCYEALAPALPGVEFPCIRSSRIVPGEPFFRMREVEGPANSETGIDVLERGAGLWRYALTPITGRKHQLRVHMAALGEPIANDGMYPSLVDRAAGNFTAPLQLLAKRLWFVDPLSDVDRSFSSNFQLKNDQPVQRYEVLEQFGRVDGGRRTFTNLVRAALSYSLSRYLPLLQSDASSSEAPFRP